MIVEETDVLLDPDKLAAAEEMILAGLGRCRTWSDLLRLVQRAVITVDPLGAEKRRKLAEREQARVRFWRENSGTCGLQGTGLPTDEALRAHAGIEARVQAYRKAGIRRYVDLLRVMALLDILNDVPIADRVARCQAEDAEREAESEAESAQYARDAKTRQTARDKAARMKGRPHTPDGIPDGGTPDGIPDDGIPDGIPDGGIPDGGVLGDDDPGLYGDYPLPEDPCANCTPGNCPCRDLEPPEPPCDDCGCSNCRCGIGAGAAGDASRDEGPGGSHDGNGPGGGDPDGRLTGGGHEACPECGRSSGFGLPIRGNLTLPLETLQGKAQRPGEAHGLGALIRPRP